jgi:hypothetical protein
VVVVTRSDAGDLVDNQDWDFKRRAGKRDFAIPGSCAAP